jgi:ribose-phosphate pyrophosphokinase
VHDNVRQTHCFIVQPVSSPVNDSLMELLLLISTLRRASAAEITAVIPYYGYERQDRKLASRVPISAADVAIMLEEVSARCSANCGSIAAESCERRDSDPV